MECLSVILNTSLYAQACDSELGGCRGSVWPAHPLQRVMTPQREKEP